MRLAGRQFYFHDFPIQITEFEDFPGRKRPRRRKRKWRRGSATCHWEDPSREDPSGFLGKNNDVTVLQFLCWGKIFRYRRSDPWCHDRYVPSADRRTGAAFHPTASAPRATGAPPEQRSDLLRWIVKMAGEWRRVRLNFMTSSVKLDIQQYGYLPVCFSFFSLIRFVWRILDHYLCSNRAGKDESHMCCFAFLDFFLAIPFGWVLDFLPWASGSSRIRKILGLCQVAVLHPLSLWHWRVLHIVWKNLIVTRASFC